MGTIGDLAHLGGPDVRQPQDAVELELELVLVEIPQALAEAAGRAAADLVEARLDEGDLAIVIEIELKPRQHQRHDRREQQHGGEEPRSDTAARPVEEP